jgi:hypothetical protein
MEQHETDLEISIVGKLFEITSNAQLVVKGWIWFIRFGIV